MDVDDTSPQSSEEGPSNRKFVEKMQYCTITLETKDADPVLRPINAVLNSGGGIVRMKIDDLSRYKPEDLNKKIDKFWLTLEQKLNPMIQPSTYDDVFDRKLEGDTILLFIKATEHFCTVDYNLHLPNDAAFLPRPPYNKVVDLLSSRDSLENHTPEVPLTDLPMDLLPKKFTHKEVLNFHESKQVQLKSFTSMNGLFHPNNRKAQDKIAGHISSFGNGSGGMILIGIEDKKGEILGQNIAADGTAEWKSEFQAMFINKMSKTWSFTPKQGEHWDVQFFPVEDCEQTSFVIVILVAGMKNLGGIFTKCPKSFELQNPSGSDGGEEMASLDFSQWKERMLRSACRVESKGVKELRKKFENLGISSKGPLLTIHNSVEEIQKDFFPVDFECPVSPKGFESNLPEAAQQVIRQIQEQNSRGRERALLVASPSMLSSVKRDEKRSTEDGVICDLLLFNKELGGLQLFTLVYSGSKDQFLPYSHATAKAVKESLVMNGGCYEKFYITSHVVPCSRVGTETLEKLSPDSRYPKEYHLQSSRGKIFQILRSLVTVLAQFPSFLSNKEGLTFLNLLTKQQFQLLHEDVDEHRELWIKGAAGTGKTVVAVEFIRELLRRDPNLRHSNILYVCENVGLRVKISNLRICECSTRKAFMSKTFPNIRHVILDEVQAFRDEDGDWLGKARRLVRQHASHCESKYSSYDPFDANSETDAGCCSGGDDDPGYLWGFIDRNQINHTFRTGIPGGFQQTSRLTKVIRNSINIFDFAKGFLNDDNAKRQLSMGHDFDGEVVRVVTYQEGQQTNKLIKELKLLFKEGYSKGDIAILFEKDESIPATTKQEIFEQFHVTALDVTFNDSDVIVLSTFRKYSGLERPVVIAVDIIASLTQYGLPKPSIYCAATRAMVKLVFLLEKTRGQKRKECE